MICENCGAEIVPIELDGKLCCHNCRTPFADIPNTYISTEKSGVKYINAHNTRWDSFLSDVLMSEDELKKLKEKYKKDKRGSK